MTQKETTVQARASSCGMTIQRAGQEYGFLRL